MNEVPEERGAWRLRIGAGILLAAFVGLASEALYGDSCTYDEPWHLENGLAALAYGDYEPSVLHHRPPLFFMASVLPVVLAPDYDLPKSAHGIEVVRNFWREGRDGHALLCRARWITVFLAVGLGIVVFRFAGELAGARAGLTALGLYVFCPNVLAHGHLVTDDLAAAAGLTAGAYWLWRYQQMASTRRAILAGAGLGLALSAKHIGVFLIPAALAVAAVPVVRRFGNWRLPVKQLAIMLLVAFTIVWAQYGFTVRFEGIWPVPAPAYWDGWHRLLQHAAQGHDAYLAGAVSQSGWWYYYFVALFLKTPPAFGILVLASAVEWLALIRRQPWGAVCLLLPAVLALAAGMRSGQNIGVRHMLPLYPLLYVWTSQWGAAGRQRWRAPLLVAVVGLQFWAAIGVRPHYLAYFNPAAGGPQRGWRWLADSNVDWGQDLVRLREWMQRHDVPKVGLEYFGIVRPQDYGIVAEPIDGSAAEWLAISINKLLGLYQTDRQRFRWLAELEPADRAGYSILIFRNPRYVPTK